MGVTGWQGDGDARGHWSWAYVCMEGNTNDCRRSVVIACGRLGQGRSQAPTCPGGELGSEPIEISTFLFRMPPSALPPSDHGNSASSLNFLPGAIPVLVGGLLRHTDSHHGTVSGDSAAAAFVVVIVLVAVVVRESRAAVARQVTSAARHDGRLPCAATGANQLESPPSLTAAGNVDAQPRCKPPKKRHS